MSLFAKKSAWKKVVVNLWGLENHDLEMCGWDFTDRLWQKTAAPMYFAHYSHPNGEERVEIKVELDWSAQQFEQFFASQNVRSVTVEDFNGSRAYAQAYLLSRDLRGKGEPLTKDVIHWTLNMAGYAYVQEMRILSEQVAHMAENMEPMV